MKRFTVMTLALALVATVCAGCRRADKKDEPMATTTIETTPIMTTTAPTTPMMTTPTDPMMPNDSIGSQDTTPGENGGQNGNQNGQDSQNGQSGNQDNQGGMGESSRNTNRGRMRRIG